MRVLETLIKTFFRGDKMPVHQNRGGRALLGPAKINFIPGESQIASLCRRRGRETGQNRGTISDRLAAHMPGNLIRTECHKMMSWVRGSTNQIRAPGMITGLRTNLNSPLVDH